MCMSVCLTASLTAASDRYPELLKILRYKRLPGIWRQMKKRDCWNIVRKKGVVRTPRGLQEVLPLQENLQANLVFLDTGNSYHVIRSYL